MPKQSHLWTMRDRPAEVSHLGVGSAEPVGTQAAVADTAGATLAVLEAEVNKLKAVLRSFGLIAQ